MDFLNVWNESCLEQTGWGVIHAMFLAESIPAQSIFPLPLTGDPWTATSEGWRDVVWKAAGEGTEYSETALLTVFFVFWMFPPPVALHSMCSWGSTRPQPWVGRAGERCLVLVLIEPAVHCRCHLLPCGPVTMKSWIKWWVMSRHLENSLHSLSCLMFRCWVKAILFQKDLLVPKCEGFFHCYCSHEHI